MYTRMRYLIANKIKRCFKPIGWFYGKCRFFKLDRNGIIEDLLYRKKYDNTGHMIAIMFSRNSCDCRSYADRCNYRIYNRPDNKQFVGFALYCVECKLFKTDKSAENSRDRRLKILEEQMALEMGPELSKMFESLPINAKSKTTTNKIMCVTSSSRDTVEGPPAYSATMNVVILIFEF